jgi:hypothetical protein
MFQSTEATSSHLVAYDDCFSILIHKCHSRELITTNILCLIDEGSFKSNNIFISVTLKMHHFMVFFSSQLMV